jgi:hypothetical protein
VDVTGLEREARELGKMTALVIKVHLQEIVPSSDTLGVPLANKLFVTCQICQASSLAFGRNAIQASSRRTPCASFTILLRGPRYSRVASSVQTSPKSVLAHTSSQETVPTLPIIARTSLSFPSNPSIPPYEETDLQRYRVCHHASIWTKTFFFENRKRHPFKVSFSW